ncbi:MAG: FliM/FliN family flagellar motor switch protein [Puniceicoccales bacterium]|jgi:flagellar motor switch/type III secretory pathway protein FliN|nr:FliM/FliN family flagellar motor switch protein [Puniceicoccales bacterium]
MSDIENSETGYVDDAAKDGDFDSVDQDSGNGADEYEDESDDDGEAEDNTDGDEDESDDDDEAEDDADEYEDGDEDESDNDDEAEDDYDGSDEEEAEDGEDSEDTNADAEKAKGENSLRGSVEVSDEWKDAKDDSAEDEEGVLAGPPCDGAGPAAEEAENAHGPSGEISGNRHSYGSGNGMAPPVLPGPREKKGHIDSKAISSLAVTLTFETAKKTVTLDELRSVHTGYTFVSEDPITSPIEIRANGKLIGYGKLVSVENNIGVQITEFA